MVSQQATSYIVDDSADAVGEALSESDRYKARVLTRDPESKQARELSPLPNVSLIKGQTHSQSDLHAAFKGVYGAFVSTDGFILGEKNELLHGTRAYEIARHKKVKHYVWANSDYTPRKVGWDEQFHWGHNDAKGRVGGTSLVVSTFFVIWWFGPGLALSRSYPGAKGYFHEKNPVHDRSVYEHAL
jgi:hypothetical protein